MSTIKKYDEIDVNQINYSKPERVGQSFFGPISYGPSLKPLFIQTPKVKSLTNIKDMIDKKAPYLEFEVPNNKLDLYDLFLNLDDKNIKNTVTNSEEWFNKQLPLEAIDEMYKRSSKPFKKNTNPKMKVRLPIVKNEIKCAVYNQKRVFIDINEIKEDTEMILIIHIRGLKFLKSYYYCDCYISQIKVFQNNEPKYNIIDDYSILDDDADEYSEIFNQEIIESANLLIKEEKEQKLKEEEERKLKEEEERKLKEEEERKLKEEEERKLKEEEERKLKEEEERKLKEEEETQKKLIEEEIKKKRLEMEELMKKLNN